MAAIDIAGVTKTFGSHVAVDDLSLSVDEGSIYGFIGPNGSGKTTTLRMIMNILLPDRGEIHVLGRSGSAAAHDDVGYLPEERGLYRKMSVGRLLHYYGALKGAKAADVEREMTFWLERLDLAKWRHHKIEALSKGMSQKVQLIATVIARPKVVILDEPFSGLDPVNANVLRESVLELRQRGSTIVFSTHDMSVAEEMCDRIFMIFKGRKVLDGTLDEIQARYGHDTVRVRTEAGRAALDGDPGVEAVSDYGNLQEVRLSGDPQAFLARLVARTPRLPLRGDAAVAARHLRAHRQAGRRRRADCGGRPMISWRKVRTVAVTEFQHAVRSKAFIIGILLMPALAGLSAVIPKFAGDEIDKLERHVAVVDETGRALSDAVARRRSVERGAVEQGRQREGAALPAPGSEGTGRPPAGRPARRVVGSGARARSSSPSSSCPRRCSRTRPGCATTPTARPSSRCRGGSTRSSDAWSSPSACATPTSIRRRCWRWCATCSSIDSGC